MRTGTCFDITDGSIDSVPFFIPSPIPMGEGRGEAKLRSPPSSSSSPSKEERKRDFELAEKYHVSTNLPGK
jgi:hypothetical protein